MTNVIQISNPVSIHHPCGDPRLLTFAMLKVEQPPPDLFNCHVSKFTIGYGADQGLAAFLRQRYRRI